MKILLDTNVLMAQAQFNALILEQLAGNELYTLDGCIRELKGIASSRKKDAPAAAVALELLKKKGIKIIPAKGKADDALVEQGKEGFAVATNDRELIKRLRSHDIKTLRLRQKRVVTDD
ncbi:MAG: hypothetical protein HY365_00550 [Candidatus Aenigmarchaeota archaeon]|nr:hypothetical protein [Candidatus Aenigmarchaeota archaeon]